LNDLEDRHPLAAGRRSERDARATDQKQERRQSERSGRTDGCVLRASIRRQRVNVEQNKHSNVGPDCHHRPQRSPAIACCRKLAGQGHQQKRREVRHKITRGNQQGEGGKHTRKSGNPDDWREPAFPGQCSGGDDEQGQQAGGDRRWQDPEAQGEFRQHRSQDQGGCDGIGTAGETRAHRNAYRPYQPRSRIGQRQDHNRQLWE
jgi:hypothetical protein